MTMDNDEEHANTSVNPEKSIHKILKLRARLSPTGFLLSLSSKGSRLLTAGLIAHGRPSHRIQRGNQSVVLVLCTCLLAVVGPLDTRFFFQINK